jgi:hypothetical protein
MQISEAWPAIPDRSRSLFDQPAIPVRLDSNRKNRTAWLEGLHPVG